MTDALATDMKGQLFTTSNPDRELIGYDVITKDTQSDAEVSLIAYRQLGQATFTVNTTVHMKVQNITAADGTVDVLDSNNIQANPRSHRRKPYIPNFQSGINR
jgi:hypothetical protein